MTTLLLIDTSPRKDAVSRALTNRFVEAWAARFPDSTIIHRDVGANPPEHLDDDLIDALRRQPQNLNDRQRAAIAASDAMIAELQAADAIVVGAPFHNFTITGAFRTWIDHVARPGKTFGYDPETGPKGLLDDKPVFVLSTRGGNYGDADPADPHPADFQSGYLRHILAFMGIKDVRIIAANGLDISPDSRQQGLDGAYAAIDKAVAAAQSDLADAA